MPETAERVGDGGAPVARANAEGLNVDEAREAMERVGLDGAKDGAAVDSCCAIDAPERLASRT